MLNLALAPVRCGLHINDGGISAERPPTSLHSARQAGEAQQHPCLHRATYERNASYTAAARHTAKVRRSWLLLIKELCGKTSKRGRCSNERGRKSEKNEIRRQGFGATQTVECCFFHKLHLLLAAALRLQEALCGSVPTVLWSGAEPCIFGVTGGQKRKKREKGGKKKLPDKTTSATTNNMNKAWQHELHCSTKHTVRRPPTPPHPTSCTMWWILSIPPKCQRLNPEDKPDIL